ncbi:MAG: plasmid stabilization protein [Flavobacterium sp. BFFFF1]|uniref:type II toxin-antitoxin system RelE/ParE family toxin n=1 Tax=Flavobacterium sp. BFFFF1 TaxID=2015557 RepID=UPI000BD8345A|nr:type II toxin-antitoxin system RelE/ParE family toxin [Flavobacterium sp. BFFFF1]OYU78904.1 MAG: plasmid stabilization protein [Flavobacterium sp. BFFFF1]
MNYILSKKASEDLENIWLYTFENWSRDQANRYVNLLLDEIEYLCIKPESGFDFSKIRKGYFQSKVKSHFIFYKVYKKRDEIEIIRILHEMMDIESHIK